ncbi:LysE family translocator [Bradyrhizobium sp. CCBAU 11386]|uniref:LysE family translocator n=1 Tax=Bradyrhizobium sp. CCBAU 11386 TaxID=1630837 RepID=UPI002304B204|nr:hypothetical protein [Bradyrhizobium sp. CCBAU 11386]
MNFLTFFTATCFLLAMPGPTNTLLATSGAGIGISRSLHLLAAELFGYLAAIALLRLALGPVVSGIPVAAVVLRVAVSVYILGLAVMLWRVNARELRGGAVVTFRQVLITTLLNPKAMVFAFLLLPLQAGCSSSCPGSERSRFRSSPRELRGLRSAQRSAAAPVVSATPRSSRGPARSRSSP